MADQTKIDLKHVPPLECFFFLFLFRGSRPRYAIPDDHQSCLEAMRTTFFLIFESDQLNIDLHITLISVPSSPHHPTSPSQDSAPFLVSLRFQRRFRALLCVTVVYTRQSCDSCQSVFSSNTRFTLLRPCHQDFHGPRCRALLEVAQWPHERSLHPLRVLSLAGHPR